MPTASTALTAVTIAVVVTASAALAAGPASSAARAYTARLDGPDAPENAPRVRRPRLLDRRPQATAVLILTIPAGWWGARAGALADTVTALPLVAILVVACSVDTATRLGVDLAVGASTGRATWPAGRAGIIALGIGAVMLIMHLLRTGLGFGDVKLCTLCSAWLGQLDPWTPITGLMLGFLLGGLASVVLLLLRRAKLKQHIAFGPYLGAGAWLAWMLALA